MCVSHISYVPHIGISERCETQILWILVSKHLNITVTKLTIVVIKDSKQDVLELTCDIMLLMLKFIQVLII